MSPLLRLAPLLLLLGLPASAGAGPVAFHMIKHPSLLDLGPGPDTLFGTADDQDLSVSNPGANDDGAGNGSASYRAYNNVALTSVGGSLNVLPLFFDGSLMFPDMPEIPPAMNVAIEDFEFSLDDLASGDFTFDLPEDPGDVHSIVLNSGLGVAFSYALATCDAGVPATCIPTIEHDLIGFGFLLLRGVDPADLPGIGNYVFYGNALIAYLNYLTTLAPPDWTAILLKLTTLPNLLNPALSSVTIPLDMTNTRGTDANQVIGSHLLIMTAAYTTDPVPEPTSELLHASALACLGTLAQVRRRRRR
jgi:hypothetical protein